MQQLKNIRKDLRKERGNHLTKGSKLLVIALLIFISACNDQKIHSVEILYGADDASVIVPVTCESIEYDLVGVKTVKITKREFLDKFSKLIKNLELGTNEEKTLDVRIKAVVNYNDKVDTLCMGGFFGTSLNGMRMKDNEELFKLVKSELYTGND